jgi:hypothetical protein
MSVLARVMANPAWANIVRTKPGATITSVMSVINVEVVGVTFRMWSETGYESR